MKPDASVYIARILGKENKSSVIELDDQKLGEIMTIVSGKLQDLATIPEYGLYYQTIGLIYLVRVVIQIALCPPPKVVPSICCRIDTPKAKLMKIRADCTLPATESRAQYVLQDRHQ